MAKKLLLILPNNPRGFWGKVHKGKAGLVRLSLPMLAALTPDDWQIEILDSRIKPIDFEAKVDLVGITAFTNEIADAYKIADEFRKHKTPVVLGGIHASAIPDEALNHADCVVIGEAELVWKDLLLDLEAGALKKTYKAANLCEMKNMAIPRCDLMDCSMYVGYNTIQASRGCPFDCDYCAVSAMFGKKFRIRPVDEVINEIKAFKGNDFFFLDDNICGNVKFAKELFTKLIPLKKTWGSQTSVTLAHDDELLKLYHKSGGRYAFIGFETISQDSLAGVNKKWSKVDTYVKDIRKIQNAGICIIGSFIFGLDQDDVTVFKETLDFIDACNLDSAQFHILTPFPGTRLFESLDKAKRIVDYDWSKYSTSEVIFKPAKMTAEELQLGYYKVYQEMYSIPRILKRVFRSPREIAYRAAINFSSRNKAMRMPKA